MDLVNKLWGFCNKLRHDGVDPSDYIEQLTYLLFIKMAEERGIYVPKGFDWNSLITKDDDALLLSHLESVLQKLKTEGGILGEIFSDPVSRVKNSKILKALIQEINSIHWTSIDADVVGLAFEELIGRVANEGKKGAGQYFTPRPLIQTIVNVIKPNPLESKNFNIGDVAVGTAGFLVVSYEWFKSKYGNHKLSKTEQNRIVEKTYFGQELVQRPRRLALMNMFLHGVNAEIKLGDTIYGVTDERYFSCILSNPPFGNKGSKQVPDRSFPVKTSDKQLNFIQHIIEKLKPGGRAAIVLPDSCLSNDAAKRIWSYYLDINKSKSEVCNLHTIIKLPEGIFAAYANGVKACVLFFQKSVPTETLWMYDARKGTRKITTKSNILELKHFEEFERSYGSDPNGTSIRTQTDRFVPHSFDSIVSRGFDLSFTEIIKSAPLPHPEIIIDEMIADYERKISALKELKSKLSANDEYSETLVNDSSSADSSSSKRKKTSKIIK
ncbi:type I restriction enzyme M protein [Mucilaginibacter mallensis]|uniref:site-specific DNA-methyltransferase (adenine-specific) n=1 Tax=Mucilaginibacter mallensis TaxID=652787 RepID=A0A1H1MC76_MUCMA|nr:class I SAM-dependent DNA methyltransferase [Mucilaginibacter mallensis]SDR83955.1 type I restriction enzyme M protein [Mucilaginibacter mallensis]